ncbi:MAG: YceI family protein [Proteobacteria bacterium]|nr:YceI family protein [Pseudomonadota bacterium]
MIGKLFQVLYLIFFVSIVKVVSAQNYVIQKDHSQIFFKVNYLSHGHVQGQFKIFQGTLRLDETGVIQALNVKIQSQSLDTGHIQRDGHLRAHDFFYTQKYPEMSFDYQKTLKRSGQKYVIEGALRIKDTVRTQVFELTLAPEEKDSWEYVSRFVELRGSLNRQIYGLSWNKTLSGLNFLVSDEVEVTGVIQLQLVHAQTPASKHMIPDGPAMRLREKAQRGEVTEVVSIPASSEQSTAASPPVSSPVKASITTPSASLKPKRPVNQDPWFWVLGLMGFGASIVLGLYGKKLVMDYFPEYEEDSLKGHLSDFITIGFSLLYALAYWMVGWGD